VADSGDFFVRFWGVRGSIACCDSGISRYGGNTSCLEVRCGERLMMFDAGTGFRYLGNSLMAQPLSLPSNLDADLFLTHTHFDHVCGLPFFKPAFLPTNRFRIFAGHLLPDTTVRRVLQDMMMAPLFPVPLQIFEAEVTFHDFYAGETLTPREGITVRTAPLNHPNGATGYRIEYGGRSICYLTDTEHIIEQPDENILELIEGADIVIYDSMYTDTEFTGRAGWGHSTWTEGMRLCEQAGAKQFVIFHHHPEHDDDLLDQIGCEAAELRPGTVVASEGMVLRP
jgi:phosphoribosyl 1,2-cyclic phosphodiesterase